MSFSFTNRLSALGTRILWTINRQGDGGEPGREEMESVSTALLTIRVKVRAKPIAVFAYCFTV
jgi:hypothetical protein